MIRATMLCKDLQAFEAERSAIDTHDTHILVVSAIVQTDVVVSSETRDRTTSRGVPCAAVVADLHCYIIKSAAISIRIAATCQLKVSARSILHKERRINRSFHSDRIKVEIYPTRSCKVSRVERAVRITVAI